MFTVDSLLLRCLLFHCRDYQGPLDECVFRIYETKKDLIFESWIFIVVRLFITFILGISILFGHPVNVKMGQIVKQLLIEIGPIFIYLVY